MSVKNKLIKIAYQNPELRKDLLPLIMKVGSEGNLQESIGVLINSLETAIKSTDGDLSFYYRTLPSVIKEKLSTEIVEQIEKVIESSAYKHRVNVWHSYAGTLSDYHTDMEGQRNEFHRKARALIEVLKGELKKLPVLNKTGMAPRAPGGSAKNLGPMALGTLSKLVVTEDRSHGEGGIDLHYEMHFTPSNAKFKGHFWSSHPDYYSNYVEGEDGSLSLAEQTFPHFTAGSLATEIAGAANSQSPGSSSRMAYFYEAVKEYLQSDKQPLLVANKAVGELNSNGGRRTPTTPPHPLKPGQVAFMEGNHPGTIYVGTMEDFNRSRDEGYMPYLIKAENFHQGGYLPIRYL